MHRLSEGRLRRKYGNARLVGRLHSFLRLVGFPTPLLAVLQGYSCKDHQYQEALYLRLNECLRGSQAPLLYTKIKKVKTLRMEI